MPSLFDPVAIGGLQLKNRIWMAPLTRGRATKQAVPTPVMAQYYAQRADAGLIISEATGISREGLGWPFAPGLWSDAQVEGWKPVTEAVHKAGGRMVAQLWHMGRVVHPDLGGGQPVSASATTAPHYAHTYEGRKPYVQARALTVADIERIVGDYASAAHNAIAAGFDGIQVHGANGYLVDQFLRSSANLREDEYGGDIDNRMRFMTQVLEAIGAEIGMERTGIRFSPNVESQGVVDPDPVALYSAVAKRLQELKVPWIEMREPGADTTFGSGATERVSPAMRKHYSGVIALNSDYDGASGQARLDEGVVDAIAFGRTFLANPDLVARISAHTELNEPDGKTFYTQGPEGYTDYPTLEDERKIA
jgi:2,4-dienoyl-CoA reductase-like NADH-dependent reductase (Old Yellow Enzyme family)